MGNLPEGSNAAPQGLEVAAEAPGPAQLLIEFPLAHKVLDVSPELLQLLLRHPRGCLGQSPQSLGPALPQGQQLHRFCLDFVHLSQQSHLPIHEAALDVTEGQLEPAQGILHLVPEQGSEPCQGHGAALQILQGLLQAGPQFFPSKGAPGWDWGLGLGWKSWNSIQGCSRLRALSK